MLGAFERRTHQFLPKLSVLYIHTSSKREVVVVLETARPMSATDRSLVEVFCSRLSVAFDNVILYDQLHEANIRLEERVRERTHELTAANQRLASQWTQLRRSNEFKNEILGTVAHDLRNPLGVILGRAEMMNELATIEPVQIDKIKDQLGHIRASADPADRDGQRPDLRRDDGRAQYRHPARAGRPGDDARRDRERQPGAGREEEPEPSSWSRRRT